MLTQELVNLINLEADELLDTDEDNIPYVNQAIDLLSFFLAGMADPEMMVVTDVHEGDNVPAAFVDFIPHNGYPVNINGGRFRIVSGDSVVYDESTCRGSSGSPAIQGYVCWMSLFNSVLSHQEEDVYPCRVLHAG